MDNHHQHQNPEGVLLSSLASESTAPFSTGTPHVHIHDSTTSNCISASTSTSDSNNAGCSPAVVDLLSVPVKAVMDESLTDMQWLQRMDAGTDLTNLNEENQRGLNKQKQASTNTNTATSSTNTAPAAIQRRRSRSFEKDRAKDSCRKKLDYNAGPGGVRKDTNSNKPPLSYASLIVLAICSTPQKMMTLSSIYRWIETNFPFYRTPESKAWKNSIRHNLSIRKSMFIKVYQYPPRRGNGSYWALLADGEEELKRAIPLFSTLQPPVLDERSVYNRVPSTYKMRTKGQYVPILPISSPSLSGPIGVGVGGGAAMNSIMGMGMAGSSGAADSSCSSVSPTQPYFTFDPYVSATVGCSASVGDGGVYGCDRGVRGRYYSSSSHSSSSSSYDHHHIVLPSSTTTSSEEGEETFTKTTTKSSSSTRRTTIARRRTVSASAAIVACSNENENPMSRDTHQCLLDPQQQQYTQPHPMRRFEGQFEIEEKELLSSSMIGIDDCSEDDVCGFLDENRNLVNNEGYAKRRNTAPLLPADVMRVSGDDRQSLTELDTNKEALSSLSPNVVGQNLKRLKYGNHHPPSSSTSTSLIDDAHATPSKGLFFGSGCVLPNSLALDTPPFLTPVKDILPSINVMSLSPLYNFVSPKMDHGGHHNIIMHDDDDDGGGGVGDIVSDANQQQCMVACGVEPGGFVTGTCTSVSGGGGGVTASSTNSMHSNNIIQDMSIPGLVSPLTLDAAATCTQGCSMPMDSRGGGGGVFSSPLALGGPLGGGGELTLKFSTPKHGLISPLTQFPPPQTFSTPHAGNDAMNANVSGELFPTLGSSYHGLELPGLTPPTHAHKDPSFRHLLGDSFDD